LPEGRGFELHGCTFRFRTEVGHLYVTVNADGDGRPLEVFVRTGRCGSTLNSLAEALGRLASLALRSGADPRSRRRWAASRASRSGAALTRRRSRASSAA